MSVKMATDHGSDSETESGSSCISDVEESIEDCYMTYGYEIGKKPQKQDYTKIKFKTIPATHVRVKMVDHDMTLSESDRYVFINSMKPITLHLPAMTETKSDEGIAITIKNCRQGVVHKIQPQERNTINNITVYNLKDKQSVTLVYNGESWLSV